MYAAIESIHLTTQEEHQWTVYGSCQWGQSVVRLHCWSRGQFTASVAPGHQHEEDLHHRCGCCQEEEPVYPGQTPSGT